MSTVLQLGNSNNWESLPSISGVSATVPSYPEVHIPINSLSVPILINSPLVVALASSASKKLSWNYSGTLAQKIRTGIVVGGGQDAALEAGRRVNFDRLTLFRFSDIAASYELIFFPAPWLKDVLVQFWQYTGLMNTSISDNLTEITTQLSVISQDVTVIRGNFP